jgi:folate-dependent phosphoribosylglycinamide formyltransferase PurN
MGGNLQEIINRLPSMQAPTRMCIVSVSEAARMVRDRAANAGIDTGGRFALTKAETAEIAALPFGRRSKKTKARVKA